MAAAAARRKDSRFSEQRQRQDKRRRQPGRRHDPGRRRDELADHHRVRAGVPQFARGDRPARRAPRAGLYRGADRRIVCEHGRQSRHSVAGRAAVEGGNNGVYGSTNLGDRHGNEHRQSDGGRQSAAVEPCGARGGGSRSLPAGPERRLLHNIFGNVFGTRRACCRRCRTSADANVLSTPNLITLDNEEAKIVVGTERAVETGSYANARRPTRRPRSPRSIRSIGATSV